MVDYTGCVGNGLIVDAGCVGDGLIANTGCMGGGLIAKADCTGDGLIANAGCADDGLIRRPNGWCLVRWVWACRARMWRNGWPIRSRPVLMGCIYFPAGEAEWLAE